MPFDLVLRGGSLIDGSGGPARQADVGVLRDRITAVGDLSAIADGDVPLVLDVTGFVGYAEAGPLDVPVLVQDPAVFDDVFGPDLVLADGPDRPLRSLLGPTVRAFFDNGGVRCYAVRVTGPNPATARWELPGVQIWQQDGAVSNVVVDAAWPGSWSAGLQVSTAPIARPLAADAVYRRAGAAPDRLQGLPERHDRHGAVGGDRRRRAQGRARQGLGRDRGVQVRLVTPRGPQRAAGPRATRRRCPPWVSLPCATSSRASATSTW